MPLFFFSIFFSSHPSQRLPFGSNSSVFYREIRNCGRSRLLTTKWMVFFHAHMSHNTHRHCTRGTHTHNTQHSVAMASNGVTPQHSTHHFEGLGGDAVRGSLAPTSWQVDGWPLLGVRGGVDGASLAGVVSVGLFVVRTDVTGRTKIFFAPHVKL